MPEPRRFCVRGHDTWQVGRTANRTCRACAREAARAFQAAEEELQQAERAEFFRKQQAQRERHRKAWRASLRGPALLNQLMVEAQEELRCPEVISKDPPAVCGKKLRGEWAGISFFFCAAHDTPYPGKETS